MRPAGDAAGAQPASGRPESLPDHRLASGPGLVAAAFGIDVDVDRHGPVRPGDRRCGWSRAGRTSPRRPIRATPRIGIAYAGAPWADARRGGSSIAGHPSASGPAALR